MKLPATIPVTIAYELYQLNADFQPGELSLGAEQHCPHFPYLDTVLGKQQAVKKWLSDRHIHLESLYFTCKVLRQDTEAVIFTYEDFFEPDPDKRCAIFWRWDPIHKQGVGLTLYTEQHN